MTQNGTETTATIRLSSGTKAHLVLAYGEGHGDIGRYTFCGADTRYHARMPATIAADCKRCLKAQAAR